MCLTGGTNNSPAHSQSEARSSRRAQEKGTAIVLKKLPLALIPAGFLFAATALPSFAGTLPQVFLDPPVCAMYLTGPRASLEQDPPDVWISVSGPTAKAQAVCSQLQTQLHATPIDFSAGNEPPNQPDGYFMNKSPYDVGIIVSYDTDTDATWPQVTNVNRASYNAAEAISHKLPSLGFSQYGKLASEY
jgi:hypothetical protein